ncbi:MAG: hypothetical protein JWR20_2285, partial [Marmoricola sp.]|nr:hypothetical protein [Marmoricola sp.]
AGEVGSLVLMGGRLLSGGVLVADYGPNVVGRDHGAVPVSCRRASRDARGLVASWRRRRHPRCLKRHVASTDHAQT